MKMVREMVPVSVLICTKDRWELLKKCLNAVLGNTVLPSEIVVCDSSFRPIGRESLKAYLGGYKGKIKYIKSVGKNISHYRNVALDGATNDICMFVDDDVELDKRAVGEIYKSHKISQKKIVGGVGYPIDEASVVAQFHFNTVLLPMINFRKQNFKVKFWPTMIFSFKKSEAEGLKFDPKLDATEDVGFCLDWRKAGGSVWVNSKVKGKHRYRETIWGLYKTFLWYFGSLRTFYNKHQNQDVFGFKEILDYDLWQLLNYYFDKKRNPDKVIDKRVNPIKLSVYNWLLPIIFKTALVVGIRRR